MAKIIGIDLGTTNCCVVSLDGDKPKVVPTKEGSRIMPSVVAITEKGDHLVGQLAKRQARMNPEGTAFAIKRFMGRKFKDPEVQKAKDYLPFTIEAAPNGDVMVNLRGEKITPAEVSAMLLSELKAAAELHFEDEIDDAIITVPAYFDDAQRTATKDAGRIAGLNVKRIINEPTAAALAYGIEMKEGKKIVVYDLGGGTFDVTVLLIGEGVFEVLATSGDTFLGGHDFDQRIVEWMIMTFDEEHSIDLKSNKMALQRLIEEAEKAKCDLSSTDSVEIQIPFIATDEAGQTLHFQGTLSRDYLESMTEDLVGRTEQPCRDALKEAGLKQEEIDEVLLVGGQTRMPYVRKKVEEWFGRAPNASLSPDEVVGVGAALQGGILKGDVKDIILLDVTPLSLGIETQGGIFVSLISRNSSIPTKKTRTFTTVMDNQTTVEIRVFQGESELCRNNRSLAYFELRDIPAAPRGLPEIEVTFAIDANGIVNVSAVDKATGRAQNIVVQPSSGLSETEIQGIIEKSSDNKEEEEKRIELIQLRNRLDAMVYQTKRSFNEYKNMLGERQAEKIEDLVRIAGETVREGTISDCNDMIEELREVGRIIATAVM